MIINRLKTITRKTNSKARSLVLPAFSLLFGLSLCGLIGITIIANGVNALTYQSNIPVQFTFNPTISINLSSSDLIISDLTPGSSADSNIISVSVATNAAYGYNLSATVGSKGGTSALTNPNTTATFTNLATTAGTAATLTSIPENYWGYSYSIDNGTNWISGSIDSPAAGYAGLPLDDNDNANEKGKGGITLQSTTEASEATPIEFKIGAKASNSQPSGEYTNTINFYAVTNPEPEIPKTIATATTMQEVASKEDGGCPDTLPYDQIYTLTDSRNNSTYRVRHVGEECYMLDNLALDITDSEVQNNLTSSTTNASDTSLNYLKGINTGTASDQYPLAPVSKTWISSAQDTLSSPMIAVDSATSGPCSNAEECANSDLSWSSTDYISSTISANGTTDTTQGYIGVYYNFCAASAGSYCWNEQSYSPDPDRGISEDICPKGWKLIDWGYSQEDGENYLDNVKLYGIALSGDFKSGKARLQKYMAGIWSSQLDVDGINQGLFVYDEGGDIDDPGWISSQYYMYLEDGHSVRCELK